MLVDDLSRLARDNYLMLTVLAELQFAGVNVVSVADGLDSHDAEATLGIQIRGIFNELQVGLTPWLRSSVRSIPFSRVGSTFSGSDMPVGTSDLFSTGSREKHGIT